MTKPTRDSDAALLRLPHVHHLAFLLLTILFSSLLLLLVFTSAQVDKPWSSPSFIRIVLLSLLVSQLMRASLSIVLKRATLPTSFSPRKSLNPISLTTHRAQSFFFPIAATMATLAPHEKRHKVTVIGSGNWYLSRPYSLSASLSFRSNTYLTKGLCNCQDCSREYAGSS